MTIEVEYNRVDEVHSQARAGVVWLLGKTAAIGQNTATAKAPVWTGNLRDSIKMNVEWIGRHILEAVVYTYTHYAVYQEFGTGRYAENGRGRKTPWTYYHPDFGFVTTVGNKPQPYMRPGYEAARQWCLANAERFMVNG